MEVSALKDAAWRDFWSGGGNAAEALGGVHASTIASDWRHFFASFGEAAPRRIVDVAAGAGAALNAAARQFGARSGADFIALDIAEDAARRAARDISGAAGIVCDSAALPFGDRSVDLVISQFGIEYSGVIAFDEAARIVRPGGAFRSISHLAGGGIETECAQNAQLLARFEGSGVYAAARVALEDAFRRRREGFAADPASDIEGAFASAARRAIDIVGAASQSAAKSALTKFLSDLSALAGRRLAYDERDALGWLDGMGSSLAAYRERMQSMCAAAIDDARLAAIEARFRARGFKSFTAAKRAFIEGAAPAALVIEARRGD